MDKSMIPILGVMMVIMALSIMFTMQGMGMQNKVNEEEARFHALQEQYWSIDKSTRDAAPTGSELNRQLVEIKNTPSELLRLKLVGIGNILAGIFILLFGILIALMIMPGRLKKLIMSGKKQAF